MKFFSLTRRRAARAKRAHDANVEGLLTSLYTTAVTGLANVDVEQRAGETEEEHSAREVVEQNMRQAGALLSNVLMLRNELSRRRLLHLVPDEKPQVFIDRHGTTTVTMKRTLTEKPE